MKSPRWYHCKVTDPSTPLGPGFTKVGPAYARKRSDGVVVVFNGGYAIRVLTVEEARAHLQLGTKMDKDKSAAIERRYDWELHR